MSSPAYIHPDFTRIVPASAKSVSCRLNLEPTGNHQGTRDGGWWPRSNNARAELPGLILIIDAIRGQVQRLVPAVAGWDDRPRMLTIGHRIIRLDYYGNQPARLLTAFCIRSRVDLLVVPPATGRAAADAAMIHAMTTRNHLAVPHQVAASVRSDMSGAVGPK